MRCAIRPVAVRPASRAARRFCGVVLLSALVTAAAGCGTGEKQAAEREESNIKKLAILYGQYQAQHRGRPPGSADDFKTWVRSLDPAKAPVLQGTANVDSLFVSPRDNQPYQFVFDAPRGVPDPSKPAVIIYEKTGVEGKRMVAYALGGVEEVDEAKFQQLVPQA